MCVLGYLSNEMTTDLRIRESFVVVKVSRKNDDKVVANKYKKYSDYDRQCAAVLHFHSTISREAPADGSSTRGGSTFVRGRVLSPHISGGRPAAGSQRADSLSSCATQPACI